MTSEVVKESNFPIPTTSRLHKAQRIAYVAQNLAAKMGTGEYVQINDPLPTFFFKVGAWNETIELDELDLHDDPKIVLDNGIKIKLNEEHVNGGLNGKEKCRLVILAENGFSTYTVSLN